MEGEPFLFRVVSTGRLLMSVSVGGHTSVLLTAKRGKRWVCYEISTHVYIVLDIHRHHYQRPSSLPLLPSLSSSLIDRVIHNSEFMELTSEPVVACMRMFPIGSSV